MRHGAACCHAMWRHVLSFPSLPSLALLRRDEVASCSERAYASLTLADAQALLMLGSQAEAEAYAKQVRAGGRQGGWLRHGLLDGWLRRAMLGNAMACGPRLVPVAAGRR